jgi:pimeloyl-ACP methyl ester carboxylesterase
MSLISNLVQLTLIAVGLLLLYLFVCIVIILVLAKLPREDIDEIPDWGVIKEERIPTVNGKSLECWVVKPEVEVKHGPAIILLHGWGRNRGRMVSRARIYAGHGFTTILISVRDHGESSRERFGMSIIKFSEDLDACINWWGKSVIICGHSIGGGATLLVGSRNPLVRAIIAEAPPISFPHDFKFVYRPGLRGLTGLFIPGITLVVLGIFRRFHTNDYSPIEAASRITIPTLIIMGKKDDIFPYEFAELLKIKNYNLEDLPGYKNKISTFLQNNGLL